jgi:hypothetical protein
MGINESLHEGVILHVAYRYDQLATDQAVIAVFNF